MVETELKKLDKAYQKRLVTLINHNFEIGSKDFMPIFLTYLAYLRDRRVLKTDLRKVVDQFEDDTVLDPTHEATADIFKDIFEKSQSEDTPIEVPQIFDNLTTELIDALTNYQQYIDSLTKLCALRNSLNLSEEEAMSNPLIVALIQEGASHWARFWQFIEVNINRLAEEKDV